MKRFKVSELKKTSAEYWILESIKYGVLTYDNHLMYQGYRIFHEDEIDPMANRFKFVHDDYDGAPDANDYRFGVGISIMDCVKKINEIGRASCRERM